MTTLYFAALMEEAAAFDVPVIVIGPGKVSAATTVLMELQKHPSSTEVVLVGTCGSLDNHEILSVWEPPLAMEHDFPSSVFEKLTGRDYGPRRLYLDGNKLHPHIATGDVFVQDRLSVPPSIGLVDMESYAVAHVVWHARGQTVRVVKCVTDHCDGESVGSWRDVVAAASEKLAEHVLGSSSAPQPRPAAGEA